VRRAASEGKRELRSPAESGPAVPVTPAEKQLLRAFLDSEEWADEFLPQLIESGDAVGLTAEGLFHRMLQARSRGEKLEMQEVEESMTEPERRLVYDALMHSGEPLDRAQVTACLAALRRRRLERDRHALQVQIQSAERDKNVPRLNQLLVDKANITRQLTELERGAKNFSQNETK